MIRQKSKYILYYNNADLLLKKHFFLLLSGIFVEIFDE